MAKGDRKARKAAEKQAESARKTWKTVDNVAAIAGILLAPKVSNAAWWAITGRKAPDSPRHPELSMGEALTYAAASGAAVAIFRTVVRRWVARYWLRSTGDLPPGMSHLNG